MNELSPEQRDRIAKLLAFSATSGGWFLVAMGLFVAGLVGAMMFSLFKFDSLEPEVAGPLLTLALAFFGVGGWLIGRRRKIRRLLDGELLAGSAVITEANGPSDTGWQIKMNVRTPSGMEAEGGITGYGPPPWQVGDAVELLFLPDEERFFPREFDFNASMGQIKTTQRAESNKRVTNVILIVVGSLFLLGLLIGIIDSVTN